MTSRFARTGLLPGALAALALGCTPVDAGSGFPTWSKSYGGPGADHLYDAVPDGDGGFLAAGVIDRGPPLVEGSVEGDFWLARLRANGDVEESVRWGRLSAQSADGFDAVYARIAPGPADSTWLVGTHRGGAPQLGTLALARVDGRGELIDARRYGGPEDRGLGVIGLSDGGAIVTALSSFNRDGEVRERLLAIRVDADLEPRWTATIGGQDEGRFIDALVAPTPEGGAIVALTEFSYALVAKLNPDGTRRWETRVDPDFDFLAYRAVEVPPSSTRDEAQVFVVGETSSRRDRRAGVVAALRANDGELLGVERPTIGDEDDPPFASAFYDVACLGDPPCDVAFGGVGARTARVLRTLGGGRRSDIVAGEGDTRNFVAFVDPGAEPVTFLVDTFSSGLSLTAGSGDGWAPSAIATRTFERYAAAVVGRDELRWLGAVDERQTFNRAQRVGEVDERGAPVGAPRFNYDELSGVTRLSDGDVLVTGLAFDWADLLNNAVRVARLRRDPFAMRWDRRIDNAGRLGYGQVPRALELASGRLVVAVEEAVHLLDHGDGRVLEARSLTRRVTALEEVDGRIWAGTVDGLRVLRPDLSEAFLLPWGRIAAIAEAPEGGAWVAVDGFPELGDLTFARVDGDGEVDGARVLRICEPPRCVSPRSSMVAVDGGFVLAVEVGARRDIVVLRYDGTGAEPVWGRRYGSARPSLLGSIAAGDRGGFAVSGSNLGLGNGGDAWVLRLDDEGLVDDEEGCAALIDSSTSLTFRALEGAGLDEREAGEELLSEAGASSRAEPDLSAATLTTARQCTGFAVLEPDAGVTASRDGSVDAGPDLGSPDDMGSVSLTCQSLGPNGMEVVVDGDFELADPLLGGVPTSAGVWQGDETERVMTSPDVEPFGASMVRYVSTRSSTGGPPDNSSVLYQVMDVASLAEGIDDGEVRAWVDARVYRVAGESVDTLFLSNLYPSPDPPAGFMLPVGTPPTQATTQIIAVDGWQRLHLMGPVPPGTRSLGVRLSAVEDVSDDAVDELAGHYLDAVSVRLFCGECPPLPADVGFGPNRIGDPGFESGTYDGTGIGRSSNWHGDWAQSVVALQGITPRSGARMLRFRGTSPATMAGSAGSSEVFRVVDLADLPVGPGDVVRAQAFFNRVAGDAETDDLFQVLLYAYPSPPSMLLDDWRARNHLARGQALVLSDDDPATWECVSTELVIPPGSRYLLVQLAANENRVNDETGVELDGHYADDVEVFIGTEE
ncbi:MAG: hypothetical protein ACFCGT_22640 [Sandaracinaceae bacterium]